MDKNLNEIDTIVAKFFDVFTNTNGQKSNVEGIKEYFLPESIIINNTSGIVDVYKLNDFIRSRINILSSGNLKEFSESEVTQKTSINGTIAQRCSQYKKSGLKNGKPFTAKGIKNIQFVNTKSGWKIASVVWSDHR